MTGACGSTATAGPLAGFVVVDLTRVLAGPYCTMILADLGATVIKVEHPDGGDEARQFLPFIDGESAYFATFNRGKKSIALDLQRGADREILDRLLGLADVLVENFRPGALDRLGYRWETLTARHPRLVLASISGFGQTGPYRHRGAYDLVVQAMSGMMSLTGHPGAPPVRAGTSLGDLAASVFAANGIQAALLQRARTGRGSRVDVSMFECQVALLESAIARHAAEGVSPGPQGARHSGTAPFDAFKVADGHIVITAGGDLLFSRLAQVLGHREWCSDPRYATRAARVRHQAELKTAIEACLAHENAATWLARFEASGVPAGPINDVEAMLADPQLGSRGLIAPLGTSSLLAPATPVLMDEGKYPARHPPWPRLDEHREEILAMLSPPSPHFPTPP